jgi:hypothetical protein
VIADTWLLVSLRWRMQWNSLRTRSLLRKLGLGFVALWLVLGVGGFSAALGYGAGRLLHEVPTWHLDALIPGTILTVITLFLLLSSFGTELGSLFLTNDLDLLMTAPVDRRAVFISKMLDSVSFSYLILSFTAVPALVTYGLGLGYGPLYYVLMVIAVFAAPLLPAGLGALLVMLVARFAPARRVREVLGLAAALFGMSCALISQTSRLWMRDLFDPSSAQAADLIAQVQAIANLPIPTMIAGRGLTAAGTGDLAGALSGLALFLLLTIGFFALCVVIADRVYLTGWVRMQSSGSAARSQARVARDAANSGWLGRAPAYLAVALKDWRVIPRDLRNFAQMLWPLLMLPVLYINVLGGAGRQRFDPGAAANEFTRGQADLSGVFIAALILWLTSSIFTQIATTGISMEGKSWWLLKIAPISPAELLRGKFVVAWVPYVILSTVLFVGAAIWKGFSLFGFVYGWFGVELLGAGFLLVALGFAVPWAKFDWDDPRRMTSGWGWVFTTITQYLMGIIGGLLLALPLIAQVFAPQWVLLAYAVGVLATVAGVAVVSFLVVQFGLSRLPSAGEV